MEDLLIAAIIFLAVLLLATIGALLYYIGIFQSIDVGAGTPPIQRAVVAYKFAQGPYKDCGNLFCEVTRCAPDCRAIGIYYDDPKKIPAAKLRYAVGAIVAEGDVKVEKEFQDKLLAEGFKVIELPAVTNCVKTTFPYINTISILVAVYRVYPRLTTYVKEHKLCAYPMLEIYESDIIHFMAPLARQDEFFVQEAKQCVPDEYNDGDQDQSFAETPEGTPSNLDSSFESSPSPSASTFSHSSHQVLDATITDSEGDTDEHDNTDIQDHEVTSSVDVDVTESETELARAMKGDTDSSLIPEIQDISLQDSGVYSGRTSAVPNDGNLSSEVVKETATEENANDSSSSFEEIKADDVALKL